MPMQAVPTTMREVSPLLSLLMRSLYIWSWEANLSRNAPCRTKHVAHHGKDSVGIQNRA
jgi:hypothetical protein